MRYNIIISILSTAGVLFILWMFLRNPRNFFPVNIGYAPKTQDEQVLQVINFILENLPPPLPEKYSADAFFSLPSYFINLAAFLKLKKNPYSFWGDIIEGIIRLIVWLSLLNQLNNEKRELSLEYQKRFYQELIIFLKEFRICLVEKVPEKCSMKLLEFGKESHKKWEDRLRAWSSP